MYKHFLDRTPSKMDNNAGNGSMNFGYGHSAPASNQLTPIMPAASLNRPSRRSFTPNVRPMSPLNMSPIRQTFDKSDMDASWHNLCVGNDLSPSDMASRSQYDGNYAAGTMHKGSPFPRMPTFLSPAIPNFSQRNMNSMSPSTGAGPK